MARSHTTQTLKKAHPKLTHAQREARRSKFKALTKDVNETRLDFLGAVKEIANKHGRLVAR
jgi:hypothetical protein